jgi:hypothetical protein
LNGQTRREVIKKIGLASVIALPLVASLAAPSSVLAVVSCPTVACTDNSQCGPCVCSAGSCVVGG